MKAKSIIITILALAIVGTMVYAMAVKKQDSESESKKYESWKTHENAEFEFKYPDNLILSEKTYGEERYQINIKSSESLTLPIDFAIEVRPNTEKQTLQELADSSGTITPSSNKAIEEMKIDDFEAKRIVLDSHPSDLDLNDPDYIAKNSKNITIVYVIRKNLIYSFVWINKKYKQNYNSVLSETILNTFDFKTR